MQAVGAAVAPLVDAVAVDDDVGVIGTQHGRVTTPGGHRQHDVIAASAPR